MPPEHEELADEALCEIERRLLGEGWAEPSSAEAGRIWVAVATFMDGRIQATPGEKMGRNPDLSPAAAAAMRAVLLQLRAVSSYDQYAENHEQMLAAVQGHVIMSIHSQSACREAGVGVGQQSVCGF